MSRPAKRIGAALIAAFWVVMMALLIQRQAGRTPAGEAQRSRAQFEEASDTWMGIYAGGGNRIGTINVRGIPAPRAGEPGLRYFIKSNLDVTVISIDTALRLYAEAWVGMESGPAEFDVTLLSGPHETRVAGRIVGGRLEGELSTGGERLPLSLQIPEGFFASQGGMSGLGMPPLQPGEEMEVDAFDPITMKPRMAVLRCTGEEERMIAGELVDTLIIETQLGGITSRAWVNREGEVLRAETPFGFTIERITAAEGLSDMPGSGEELLSDFNVTSTGVAPRRDAKYLRVRVGGVDTALLPETAYQTMEEGVLVISPPGAPTGPDEAGGLDAHLGSDAFITANHPRIQAMAQQVCGDATGAWERARRIYAWVFDNIEKQPAITLPVALDVLETRHGDCNEHAVLYTALARAAGVPTRIAVGLVWSDELDAFAYHAWVEVRVGGQWTPMDPTLGQEIADATHIKLLEGGIGEWAKLIPFMNRIELEILELR